MEELYGDALLVESIYEAYAWWLQSGAGFSSSLLESYQELFPDGPAIAPNSISVVAYLSGDAQGNMGKILSDLNEIQENPTEYGIHHSLGQVVSSGLGVERRVGRLEDLAETGEDLHKYLEGSGEKPDLSHAPSNSDWTRLEEELNGLDLILARLSPFLERYKEIEDQLISLASFQETPNESLEEE
jgi:hypothetical protein